jgi:RNA polymerase sigma factor (sigma-70 family)
MFAGVREPKYKDIRQMDRDTDIGGAKDQFPLTRCSIVKAMESVDPHARQDAFAELVTAYWKPVYKYIRLKWSLANEDAKDLTQAFFARAFEKEFFQRFDPAKAKFRTFLRVCVDGFVANEQKAAGRLKRGGNAEFLSLDFAGAEGEFALQKSSTTTDPEAFFHQEWIRHLFGMAVEDLRRECETNAKSVHFAIFSRYDLQDPDVAKSLTYAQLGEELGISVTQVTNFLNFVRRRFRQLLLDRLRAATGSEEEFRAEVHKLFGGNPR